MLWFIIFQVLAIGFLLIVNGAFVSAELALVSAKTGRLQELAASGDRRAGTALELMNNPDGFFSSVQIGITVLTILSGTLGGTVLAAALERVLDREFPRLEPLAGGFSIALVVCAVTYFSLLIGELVPKRLALQNPVRVALWAARPMKFFAMLTSPISFLLTTSMVGLMRLLGIYGPSRNDHVTRQDVRQLVDQGARIGLFDAREQQLIGMAVGFREKKVSQIMTPCREIIWLDADVDSDPFERGRKIDAMPHSCYPVARGSLDALLGVVHTKNLCNLRPGEKLTRAGLVEEALFIPVSSGALQVLDNFKATQRRLAFVVTEYGQLQGIVTLTDLLESLVGGMQAATSYDLRVVVRENECWQVDGMMTIDKFKSVFSIPVLPGEKVHAFHTVAGFVIAQRGVIPEVADVLQWGEWHIEVTKMDGNRIDKVLVSRIREPV